MLPSIGGVRLDGGMQKESDVVASWPALFEIARAISSVIDASKSLNRLVTINQKRWNHARRQVLPQDSGSR